MSKQQTKITRKLDSQEKVSLCCALTVQLGWANTGCASTGTLWMAFEHWEGGHIHKQGTWGLMGRHHQYFPLIYFKRLFLVNKCLTGYFFKKPIRNIFKILTKLKIKILQITQKPRVSDNVLLFARLSSG